MGDFGQVLLRLLVTFDDLLAAEHLLFVLYQGVLGLVVGLLKLKHIIHKVGRDLGD